MTVKTLAEITEDVVGFLSKNVAGIDVQPHHGLFGEKELRSQLLSHPPCVYVIPRKVLHYNRMASGIAEILFSFMVINQGNNVTSAAKSSLFLVSDILEVLQRWDLKGYVKGPQLEDAKNITGKESNYANVSLWRISVVFSVYLRKGGEINPFSTDIQLPRDTYALYHQSLALETGVTGSPSGKIKQSEEG